MSEKLSTSELGPKTKPKQETIKATRDKYNIVKVSKWLKSNSTEVGAREK